MSPQVRNELWQLGKNTIESLEVEGGLLASGRGEAFGCVFGRDSLISALSLLSAYRGSGELYFLSLVAKILQNLAVLQGTAINIESGEEPGKIIHEYRPDNHEKLTKAPERPWYVYPDGAMRIFDSVDATPLFLMTVHEYWRASGDAAFIENLLPHVRAALSWLSEYGDSNGDGFIDYRLAPERAHGGLTTQSWMDSADSVFFEYSGERPRYPIAPLEAQAYAYAALRDWAAYFEFSEPAYAAKLSTRAAALKEKFNRRFVLELKGQVSLAFALDGAGRPLTAARSSMGHALWAVHRPAGRPDSILDERFVPAIVERLLSPDLYALGAGIRTLSTHSLHYRTNSYHNGSVWPHDTAMIVQGLENFGYKKEALLVRASLLSAYRHFGEPLELFTYSRGKFGEYKDAAGHGACRTQAWSAAGLLSLIAGEPA